MLLNRPFIALFAEFVKLQPTHAEQTGVGRAVPLHSNETKKRSACHERKPAESLVAMQAAGLLGAWAYYLLPTLAVSLLTCLLDNSSILG